MSKQYTTGEVIDKLQFGQVAVKVDGTVGEPYGQIGTIMYFDADDFGVLKSLTSGSDILICRTKRGIEDDKWIIVDAKEVLDMYKS